MVDVPAVDDVEDVDGARGLVDAVHDPVSAAPGAVAADERSEQRLAHAFRVDCQRGLAEFQHCGGYGFR